MTFQEDLTLQPRNEAAIAILDVDTHLMPLKEAIWEARSQWKDIGRKLGLKEGDIRAIHEPSDGDCLHEVLLHWIQSGRATTTSLLKALESKVVGHADLAKEVRALKGEARVEFGLTDCNDVELETSQNSPELLDSALLGAPTLDELCALPIQKILYPLGLWLGIKKEKLKKIINYHESFNYSENYYDSESDYEFEDFDMSQDEVESQRVQKLFKLFLEFSDSDYEKILKSLPSNSKEQFKISFQCSTPKQIDTCRTIIEKVSDPKMKKLGKNLLERKKSKRKVLLNALIKCGCREAAEIFCSQKGISVSAYITHYDPANNPPEFVLQYASYLKEKYKQMPIIPDDWPPLANAEQEYSKVALITNDSFEEETRSMEHDYVHGHVDSIMSKKETITLNAAFYPIVDHSSNTSRLTILMDGAPGVGKTTIARKLCIDWANGELLQEYQLVIFIPLREAEGHSLASILPSPLKEATEIANYLAQLNILGKYTLFIFDGFDELSSESRFKKSLFMKIINGEVLHHSSVLVTSRPYASSSLKSLKRINRHIEVLGFSQAQIMDYMKQNLPSPSEAQKLVQLLKERLDIVSLCYIPLNCKIVLFVFEQEKYELPATLTELYEIFALHTIKRSLKKVEHFLEEDEYDVDYIEQLPFSILALLNNLCKVAFECMKKDHLFLRHSDLQTREVLSLGLLSSIYSITSRSIQKHYQFLHLTIQEFLAARHLSSANFSHKDKLEFFNGHVNEERFRMTFLFLAGLTKLDFVPEREYILGGEYINLSLVKAEDISKHKQSAFSRRLNSAHHVPDSISRHKINQQKFFYFAHLIYESGKIFCENFLKLSSNTITIFDYQLTPFDALVLAYFLSSTSQNHIWEEINLVDCNLLENSIVYTRTHFEQSDLVSLGMTKSLVIGNIKTTLIAPIIEQTVHEVTLSCHSLKHDELSKICLSLEKNGNIQIIKMSQIIFSKLEIKFDGEYFGCETTLCSHSLIQLLSFICAEKFECIELRNCLIAFQDCVACSSHGLNAVSSLSRTLEASTNIKKIDLTKCGLTQETVEKLVAAVLSKKSLELFDVDGNQLDSLDSFSKLLQNGIHVIACGLSFKPVGSHLSIADNHSQKHLPSTHSYQSHVEVLDTLLISKSFTAVTFKIFLEIKHIISVLKNMPYINEISIANTFLYRHYNADPTSCTLMVSLADAIVSHKHLQSFSGAGIHITKDSLDFTVRDSVIFCPQSTEKLLAFVSSDEIKSVNLAGCSSAFSVCNFCDYSPESSVISLCNIIRKSKALNKMNLRCDLNVESMYMIITSIEQSSTDHLAELLLNGDALNRSAFLKICFLKIARKVEKVEIDLFSMSTEKDDCLELQCHNPFGLDKLLACLLLPLSFTCLSIVSINSTHDNTYFAVKQLTNMLIANTNLVRILLPKLFFSRVWVSPTCLSSIGFAESVLSHKFLENIVTTPIESIIPEIVISRNILYLKEHFCPQALQQFFRFMVPSEVSIIDLDCLRNPFEKCYKCGCHGEVALLCFIMLLHKCDNIVLLNLANSVFPERTLQIIVDLISKKRKLQALFLNENNLNDKLFRTLLETMVSHSLQYLQMSNLVFKVLKRKNQTTLMVSFRKDIFNRTTFHFFNILITYLRTAQVSMLRIFSKIMLTDDILEQLISFLGEHSDNLGILNFSNCFVSNSALQSVAKCKIVFLTELHLHSVGLTGPIAILLFKNIASNKTLKTLNISKNKITRNCTIAALGRAMQDLLEKNKYLEVLNISECEITFVIVQYIEAGLLCNNSLKMLDISCHSFMEEKDSMSFAKSVEIILTKNYSLQVLVLNSCTFSDSVMYKIANAMQFNTTLKELHLSSLSQDSSKSLLSMFSTREIFPVGITKQQHSVSQQVWRCFFTSLKENSSLETIDISYNKFEKFTIDALRKSLHQNTSITKVIIFSCNVTENQLKEIADELPSPDCLKSTLEEYNSTTLNSTQYFSTLTHYYLSELKNSASDSPKEQPVGTSVSENSIFDHFFRVVEPSRLYYLVLGTML